MKRSTIGVILGLMLFSFSNLLAQVGTSMQFNQVLIKTFDGTSPTYTVPSGKIWKVEGAAGVGSVRIQSVNGLTVFGNINSAVSNYGENLPLWFPENTALVFSEDGNTSVVSILEFTVIP